MEQASTQGAPPRELYIPCTVAEGQFDSEYAVSIDTTQGQTSLFADRSLILMRHQQHYLRVMKFAVEGDIDVFLLPTESLETGSRWVRIRKGIAIEA